MENNDEIMKVLGPVRTALHDQIAAQKADEKHLRLHVIILSTRSDVVDRLLAQAIVTPNEEAKTKLIHLILRASAEYTQLMIRSYNAADDEMNKLAQQALDMLDIFDAEKNRIIGL